MEEEDGGTSTNFAREKLDGGRGGLGHARATGTPYLPPSRTRPGGVDGAAVPLYIRTEHAGSMTRGVMLMSGGIDSPVSLYYLLRQGHEMVCVHLDNRPFTDDSPLEKILDHLRVLRERFQQPLPLYVLPHGPTQITLMRNTDRHVGCVMCRRFMWRSAERIAVKENARFLATGESLGQVASQTLSNMRTATAVVHLPIVRPLIGFDKAETERVAREIGTYEISIRPGVCCQAVPDRPATKSNLIQIAREETLIDVEQILDDCVRNAVVM